MAPSSPNTEFNPGSFILPDGRQTRIDFFSSQISGNSASHVVHSKRNTFEWWHSLKNWIKPEKHEKEHHLAEFSDYLKEKNYSPKTCENYLFMLRKFFEYVDSRDIDGLSMGVIEDYNYDFFVSGRYSRAYQQKFISSLTHYLEFSLQVKVNLKNLREVRSRR